jgi:hypothetical protein
MSSGSLQDTVGLKYLEVMLINYVDMDLAKKDKSLLMDKVLWSVIAAVNSTATEDMKTELEMEISSSISTHLIIELITIAGLILLAAPLYCLLQRRYRVHEKAFTLFASLGVSDIQN